MAKNLRHKGPNPALALTVASGVESGDVIAIGSSGLIGHVLTDRATTDLINAGKAAPGLANGQATVRLQGSGDIVELTVASASGVTAGTPVYVDGSGNYTEDDTTATFIGWAVEAIANGSAGKVFLASAPTPTGS